MKAGWVLTKEGGGSYKTKFVSIMLTLYFGFITYYILLLSSFIIIIIIIIIIIFETSALAEVQCHRGWQMRDDVGMMLMLIDEDVVVVIIIMVRWKKERREEPCSSNWTKKWEKNKESLDTRTNGAH